MAKKSVNHYDLDDAVVDIRGNVIEEEDVPPTKKIARRSPGFLQIPAQVMARIEVRGVSLPGWGALCALQWLEFRADLKGEPLKLTNVALKMFGVSRRLKLPALDELVAREFVRSYAKVGKSSPLVRLNMKLQK